jgi:hypothetical protein
MSLEKSNLILKLHFGGAHVGYYNTVEEAAYTTTKDRYTNETTGIG